MKFKLALLISSLLVVISAFILFLYQDKELDPDALQWLSQLEKRQASNSDGYLYLLGMNAQLSEAPLTKGQMIFEQLSSGAAITPYKEIELPDFIQDCRFQTRECLVSWIENPHELSSVLREQEILLERYQQWLSYQDYVSMLPNSIELIPEDFKLAIRGHKLQLIKFLLDKAKSDDYQHYITNLSKHFESTDNLISKVIMLNFIESTLNFTQLQTIQLTQIKPLTTDFTLTFRREFEASYLLYKNLAKSPNFYANSSIGDQKDSKLYTPEWANLIFFKPNKTINHDYRYWSTLSKKSQLPLKTYFKKLATPDEIGINNDSHWNNFIGKILLDIPKPSLQKYILKTHLLNISIEIIQGKPVERFYQNFIDIEETDSQLCFAHKTHPQDQACLYKK